MNGIRVEVDLVSSAALPALLGVSEPKGGSSISSSGGVLRLSLAATPSGLGFGVGEVVPFVIDMIQQHGGEVAIGALGNWLFSVLRGSARRLIYRGHPYRIDPEELSSLLERLRRDSGGEDQRRDAQE